MPVISADQTVSFSGAEQQQSLSAWFGLGSLPQSGTWCFLGCFSVAAWWYRSCGSPAGGSQALVTKEASSFEVSFILRTAAVSLHPPSRFCFLKAWVLYPVAEQWCSVCWEKPQCRITVQNNVLSFLPPSPLPLECWESRLLRWTFPS